MQVPTYSDNDTNNFSLLLGLMHFPTLYMTSLGPRDMDKLGEEIAKALQRCSVPESASSPQEEVVSIQEEERRINENLMSGIMTFANYLNNRANAANSEDDDDDDDGRHGAFFILFRKTVATAPNLECLFRMCDPAIRTGYIRQQAIMILCLFSSELSSSCWSLKVPSSGEATNNNNNNNNNNGQSPPTSSSFARRLIVVMANALTQKQGLTPDSIHPILLALFNALLRPLGVESPKEIVELVSKFDWPTILQDNDVSLVQDKKTKFYYDYVIFLLLHTWACRLLAKDRTSDMAKAFLRNQLGSCHELLRTCLRRLIHQGVEQLGREIENLGSVVHAFMNCLVPVPVDRETNALVRRARDAFQQILLNNKTSDDPFLMDNIHLGTFNLVGQKIQGLIYNMRDWQLFAHYVTEERRWEFFQANFVCWPTTSSSSSSRCSSNTLAAQDRRLIKDFRKSCKKKVKQVRGLTGGEMCSNCFVLEKTLLEEQDEEESEGGAAGGGAGGGNNNGGLMKCSRCLQIKYCSRECQREHWKKAHKNHCKTMAATKSSSSSSSKQS